MKLGLIGGAYASGSAPLSAQECVNLYPEVAEGGGRNKASLMPTPGTSLFATFAQGPIRGAWVMDGIKYVVSGSYLYQVNSLGQATSLGFIDGVGRVTMAHNFALQLVISNGTTGYLYQATAGTYTVAGLQTIPTFPGGHVWAYLDGYILTNRPDTREFWSSQPDDAMTWNGLDFASKEADPYKLVALIENNEDVILFGEKTIEFWRDTGDSDFQFEKQTGVSQERGCGAKFSVVSLDNTVYFLGDDKVVYKLDGYKPIRISDHGIENFLESIDVSDATAFTYTSRGHYFYVLNVGGKTWVYDSTFSNQVQRSTWHERRTGTGRWRAEVYSYCYGRHFVGDYRLGKMWELTGTTDDGDEIFRIRSLPAIPSESVRAFSRLELKGKFGNGSQVWLEVSKDGARTWSDRILASTGDSGDYRHQVTWRRLGYSEDWVFRLTTSEGDVNWEELLGTEGE